MNHKRRARRKQYHTGNKPSKHRKKILGLLSENRYQIKGDMEKRIKNRKPIIASAFFIAGIDLASPPA